MNKLFIISIFFIWNVISISAGSVINLSEKHTANSYIISESGDYCFAVDNYPEAADAFILWNELGEKDIVDVKLSDGTVYFTKTFFQKGNAMISIVDKSNTILWSWHIWSTDRPKCYEKDGYNVMDRNLGATNANPYSVDSYGLSYTPGCPFPFPGPKYSDYIITSTPSAPDGWYVAPGYGFYKESKMPTSANPMMLCSHRDKYGNSVYFRIGYNPFPTTYYVPTIKDMVAVLGYEPIVRGGVLHTDFGLSLPAIYDGKANETQGFYLCAGVYNTTAVDTHCIYFTDDLLKTTYCEGAALMPLRGFMKIVEVDKLMLQPTFKMMKIGEIIYLEAKFTPSDVYDKSLEWRSSDENIVVVKDGMVTAVGIGHAFVTAIASNRKTATCEFLVDAQKINRIEVDPAEVCALEGSSIQLTAIVYPENATDKRVAWYSSDTSIAVVDGNGMLKIVGSGDAVIEARALDGSKVIGECRVSGYSGIEDVLLDTKNDWNLYTVTGILLGSGINSEDLNRLPRGMYILRSNKKAIKVILGNN